MINQKKDIDVTLKDAHDWLYHVLFVKKNLSNVKAGKILGKSDKGAPMVFENYSLGLDKIEEVANKLGLKEEFDLITKKAPESTDAFKSVNEAVNFLINASESEKESSPAFQLFTKSYYEKGYSDCQNNYHKEYKEIIKSITKQ